jgi:hypothetical protein
VQQRRLDLLTITESALALSTVSAEDTKAANELDESAPSEQSVVGNQFSGRTTTPRSRSRASKILATEAKGISAAPVSVSGRGLGSAGCSEKGGTRYAQTAALSGEVGDHLVHSVLLVSSPCF